MLYERGFSALPGAGDGGNREMPERIHDGRFGKAWIVAHVPPCKFKVEV